MSEKLEALPVPPGGRSRPVAFAGGALIGTLGGLIGLGGAALIVRADEVIG